MGLPLHCGPVASILFLHEDSMLPFISRFGLSGLVAIAALSAQAQVATTPALPAPSASKPTAPPATQQPSAPLAYKSAFDGYQPFADAKPVPWKDANNTVETVGGWRAYAKEAPEPSANDKSSNTNGQAPSTTKPANPHAGHSHH